MDVVLETHCHVGMQIRGVGAESNSCLAPSDHPQFHSSTPPSDGEAADAAKHDVRWAGVQSIDMKCLSHGQWLQLGEHHYLNEPRLFEPEVLC